MLQVFFKRLLLIRIRLKRILHQSVAQINITENFSFLFNGVVFKYEQEFFAQYVVENVVDYCAQLYILFLPVSVFDLIFFGAPSKKSIHKTWRNH
jgi:hypothetical protein